MEEKEWQERAEVFWERFREQPPGYIEELEKYAREHNVPVIRRATRDLLRFLLRTEKPERILEVGTAIGYSALFMKACLPDCQITTIEKAETRIRQAKKNLREYDPEGQIRLLEGDALEILPRLAGAEQFGLIFMDAAKGQYLKFLPDVLALLPPGGVLVTDNILHGGDVLESRYAVTRRDRTIHGRMRRYLEVLTGHEELETICLSLGDGVTISKRKKIIS